MLLLLVRWIVRVRALLRAGLLTSLLVAPTHPTAGESSHGLGLSIAHEIIRVHGGTVRVESQPGEGATFIAEFPAEMTRPA